MEKDPEIYNSKIGLEVEFIRNPNINLTTIKLELQKLLGIKINIEKEHHSKFVPTDTNFKIEPDYSLGDHSVELITGPLEYNNARIVLIKILRWIKERKYIKTNDRCGLHLNISFPNTRYIQDIDILKFILNFDENEIYNRFPNRKDNIYTKSIKDIIPLHTNFNFESLTTNRTSFVFPISKYYGINFEKLKKDYLEFRYIGGSKYELKQTEILFLLDFFIKSIKDSYYSKNEGIKDKLIEILKPKKKIFLAGQNYFNFKNIFKNIKFQVDNKNHEEILKLFFYQMWNQFYPILIRMKEVKFNMKGIINYDTDTSLLEFSGFIIKRTNIQSSFILFHDCKLQNVVLKYCEIHESKISNCDLDYCKGFDSDFINTKIKNAEYNYCNFKKCYLDSVDLLDSEIEGGIFRKGKHSSCKISDRTIVMEDDVENLDEQEN